MGASEQEAASPGTIGDLIKAQMVGDLEDELRLSGVAIDRILPLLAGSGYEDASNLLVGFDPELPANAMQPTGHVPGPRRLSDDLLQHIAWIARIEGPVEDGDAIDSVRSRLGGSSVTSVASARRFFMLGIG